MLDYFKEREKQIKSRQEIIHKQYLAQNNSECISHKSSVQDNSAQKSPQDSQKNQISESSQSAIAIDLPIKDVFSADFLGYQKDDKNYQTYVKSLKGETFFSSEITQKEEFWFEFLTQKESLSVAELNLLQDLSLKFVAAKSSSTIETALNYIPANEELGVRKLRLFKTPTKTFARKLDNAQNLKILTELLAMSTFTDIRQPLMEKIIDGLQINKEMNLNLKPNDNNSIMFSECLIIANQGNSDVASKYLKLLISENAKLTHKSYSHGTLLNCICAYCSDEAIMQLAPLVILAGSNFEKNSFGKNCTEIYKTKRQENVNMKVVQMLDFIQKYPDRYKLFEILYYPSEKESAYKRVKRCFPEIHSRLTLNSSNQVEHRNSYNHADRVKAYVKNNDWQELNNYVEREFLNGATSDMTLPKMDLFEYLCKCFHIKKDDNSEEKLAYFDNITRMIISREVNSNKIIEKSEKALLTLIDQQEHKVVKRIAPLLILSGAEFINFHTIKKTLEAKLSIDEKKHINTDVDEFNECLDMFNCIYCNATDVSVFEKKYFTPNPLTSLNIINQSAQNDNQTSVASDILKLDDEQLLEEIDKDEQLLEEIDKLDFKKENNQNSIIANCNEQNNSNQLNSQALSNLVEHFKSRDSKTTNTTKKYDSTNWISPDEDSAIL